MVNKMKQRFSVELDARIGEIAISPRNRHFGLYLYTEIAEKISRREIAVLDAGGEPVSRWEFPDEVFAMDFASEGELAVLHCALDSKPHTLSITAFDVNGEKSWSHHFPGSADFIYFDVELSRPPWLLVDNLDIVRCYHGEDEMWNKNFKRSRARSLTGVLARNPMNIKGVWNLRILPGGGAMVMSAKMLYRLSPGGDVEWEKKLVAPHKMLSASPDHVLISSDGYYAKKPEQTVLLTGEGEELWQRSLPLPLAAMGWSPFEELAALALYTEPEDGGLMFIDAAGREVATHEVHGWPRGMAFSPDTMLLFCEGGFYAFDGRGGKLCHVTVDELESCYVSPNGRLIAVGAMETLKCWER